MMMVAIFSIRDTVMITIIGCLCLTNTRGHFGHLSMRLACRHDHRCQPLQREADQYRQKRDQTEQF